MDDPHLARMTALSSFHLSDVQALSGETNKVSLARAYVLQGPFAARSLHEGHSPNHVFVDAQLCPEVSEASKEPVYDSLEVWRVRHASAN